MDIAEASEIVAGLLAAGSLKELGEMVGRGLIGGIVDRVRRVFGSDERSLDALERAQQDGSAAAVADLASALSWYAGKDQAFAQDLEGWAAQAPAGGGQVIQYVRAKGDANVAGRDGTFIKVERPR